MDYAKYLQMKIHNDRVERFSRSDQLSLGQLIDKLKAIIDNHTEDEKINEIDVHYDFEYLFPLNFGSWRGSYEELALDFYSRTYDDPPKKPLNIIQFFNLCLETVGKEFYGYKGGEFIMTIDTPIWVASHSNSGNTALIGVIDHNYQVTLITGWREF